MILSSRKDLIRLDTHALRTKAMQAHRQAERMLSQLTDTLKRYHERDVPGFRSWIHRTFGELLTRQRELLQAIEKKRSIVYEIQSMADRYGLSDLDAYRKVLWRQSHPDEALAEDRQFEESERQRQQSRANDDAADDYFDEDDPELDDIFNDETFDDIPDSERDDFNEFFETMTGLRPPSRGSNRPHPDQNSVKEIYRRIVLRLHPDHHGEMTDERKALWHETQDAYRRHDLNALHGILARCDDGKAGLGDHSPISLIRRLTQQLKVSAQSARCEIRKKKRDFAWDYETRIKNPAYVREIGTDLVGIVNELQWNCDDIERELARFDRMASRPPKPGRPPQRKPGRPPHSARQDEFPF